MSGKRKQKGKAQEGGAVDKLGHELASVSLDKNAILLFPPRPSRGNVPAPGKVVKLISNMFVMSITQNKPIRRYTVDVECIEEENDNAKENRPGKGDEQKKIRRKLPPNIRLAAVEQAVKVWIATTKPSDYSKDLEFNHLYDSNGSIMYTLFDMFAGRPETKTFDMQVELVLDAIVQGKLSTKKEAFNVKIIRQSPMDFKTLFESFTGKAGKSFNDITMIQEELKALNVILRGEISTIPMNISMRSGCIVPYEKHNQANVSPGVMINKGYRLSVRPAECGVLLNVSNTVIAFHEEILLTDLLTNRFRVKNLKDKLGPEVLNNLKKEILTKQIVALHKNYGSKQKPHYRKYRVMDVAGSSLDKFMLADKVAKTVEEITIQQYFKTEYNYTLKYPNLPCIIDKGRKVPLEVCQLVDKQVVRRRMNPEETQKIIKLSAIPPEKYFAQLKENVMCVKNTSQSLTDFGLKFEPTPVLVDGRELPTFSLIAGSNQEMKPSDGQYNAQRNRFFKPAQLKRWSLTFLLDFQMNKDKESNGEKGLFQKEFSEKYCKEGRMKGVNVPELGPNDTQFIPTNKSEPELKQLLKRYFLYLNKSKIDHNIFVLPGNCPDWVYRYMQYLETTTQEGRKAGEPWTRTSCIKFENYKKKIFQSKDDGRMFLANLWLKYNTKLGGINFVLKDLKELNFLREGYLFVSVDVCHPSPGDKLIQSVAAVVGMWDISNSKMSYCTRMRVQKKVRENFSTVEHVGEINIMFEVILASYFKKKNKLPTHIVVLRDGVSEGQFKIVLEYELRRVKDSLNKVYSSRKAALPKLSCLVVQKRHKVRFMRKEPVQNRNGLDYNIQPGTCVDSTIVHPTDFSFYLAPHRALQGTARAAHIYMIYDEIKFSQDEAQSMVHALSYLSPRCTKGTSIPTPVNLADLAAERGKNLVISWNDDNPQKLKEEERIDKLNLFLSNLADEEYKNFLFYV